MAQVSVIGSGFSGLAAACFAAKEGHKVTVFEKNDTIGGRARKFEEQGFVFDMGPSWYWMPDVFENFFSHFGKTTSDYYQLEKLDPGFQVIYHNNELLPVPASLDELYTVFEQIEPGSASKLRAFLEEAETKYTIGMNEFVFKPSYSWLEYMNPAMLKGALSLNMFSSVSGYVSKFFKDYRLVSLMEFPVLFLGAMANKIPALYTMMNYSALVQGTFYPIGGMHKIIAGMHELALSLGVQFETGVTVEKIEIEQGLVKSLKTSKGSFVTEGLIASADYHHVEQTMLEPRYRNYEASYWDKKTFAPSCLIYYIGVNQKLNNLEHHNLFFDADFKQHAEDIYVTPQWPKDPLFYACCPSKTDNSVAPEGMENLFILVPVATGLEDGEAIRERYFESVMDRLEKHCSQTIKDNIVYKRSYCIDDFVFDYNAFKGNAYGLANTLMQTAVLKPTLRNKKVKNMFYTGQLTVPGPGVPPALISGQVAAYELLKSLKSAQ